MIPNDRLQRDGASAPPLNRGVRRRHRSLEYVGEPIEYRPMGLREQAQVSCELLAAMGRG